MHTCLPRLPLTSICNNITIQCKGGCDIGFKVTAKIKDAELKRMGKRSYCLPLVWKLTSDSAGCARTKPEVCQSSGNGLLMSNMDSEQNSRHNDGCTDSTCQGVRNIPYFTLILWIINALDMSLEILVLVVMIAAFVRYMCCNNDDGAEGGPLRGIVYFFILTAVIDLGLQIAALGYTYVINDALKPFKDGKCLDTISVTGEKHTETMLKLQESVATAAVMGWIELVVMLGEVTNSAVEECTKDEAVKHVLAFILVVLQFGQVALAIVDFAVFTTGAYNDADALFGDSIKELGSSAASDIWCVSLNESSVQCLKDERANIEIATVSGNRRRLPPTAGISGGALSATSMPTLAPVAAVGIVAGMLIVGVAVIKAVRKQRV